MPTQKDAINRLIHILKDWQKIEDAAVKNTSDIIQQTENPIIRFIMEVINQDSKMHKRVQQLIIDNFEIGSITINSKELEKFWTILNEHNAIEKRTIELAEACLEETTSPLARYLLEYLLSDERKHDFLMEELEKIKKGKYPHGGVENY